MGFTPIPNCKWIDVQFPKAELKLVELAELINDSIDATRWAKLPSSRTLERGAFLI